MDWTRAEIRENNFRTSYGMETECKTARGTSQAKRKDRVDKGTWKNLKLRTEQNQFRKEIGGGDKIGCCGNEPKWLVKRRRRIELVGNIDDNMRFYSIVQKTRQYSVRENSKVFFFESQSCIVYPLKNLLLYKNRIQ